MAVHPDTMLLMFEGRRQETIAEVAQARLADAVVSAGPRAAFDRERMRFLLRALWPPPPRSGGTARPPADPGPQPAEPTDGSPLVSPTA